MAFKLLEGPIETPVGKQGGLGGEDPGGIPAPVVRPDPLGLLKNVGGKK